MKVLLEILKDTAFWLLTPVLIIATGMGFGWLAMTFSSLICAGIAVILIAVGVIWLVLVWNGFIE